MVSDNLFNDLNNTFYCTVTYLIKNAPIDEKYKKVRMYMNNYVEPLPHEIEGMYLHEAFKSLLGYRMKINDVILYNSGSYLSSGEEKYSNRKIYELNTTIKNNISEFDTTLSWIISPKQHTYILDELVQVFDYPNVDLHKIDCKYF